MNVDTLVAAGAATTLTVLYTLIGRAWWSRLIANAETPEEMEFVLGSMGLSPWMVLGRYMMIGSWPLWCAIPAAVAVWQGLRSPEG